MTCIKWRFGESREVMYGESFRGSHLTFACAVRKLHYTKGRGTKAAWVARAWSNQIGEFRTLGEAQDACKKQYILESLQHL